MKWIERLAREPKWTGPAAGALGFLEGSFVVFPMEPLFIPMMTSRGNSAWRVSAWLLFGNVLAAIFMYALGALFLEPVLKPVFAFFDATATFENGLRALREDGFRWLLLIGVTPFPFQLGVAGAGAAGYPLALFVLAVTLARGARYFAFAALVMAIGQRARDWLQRHERAIFIGGATLFVVLAGAIVMG